MVLKSEKTSAALVAQVGKDEKVSLGVGVPVETVAAHTPAASGATAEGAWHDVPLQNPAITPPLRNLLGGVSPKKKILETMDQLKQKKQNGTTLVSKSVGNVRGRLSAAGKKLKEHQKKSGRILHTLRNKLDALGAIRDEMTRPMEAKRPPPTEIKVLLAALPAFDGFSDDLLTADLLARIQVWSHMLQHDLLSADNKIKFPQYMEAIGDFSITIRDNIHKLTELPRTVSPSSIEYQLALDAIEILRAAHSEKMDAFLSEITVAAQSARDSSAAGERPAVKKTHAEEVRQFIADAPMTEVKDRLKDTGKTFKAQRKKPGQALGALSNKLNSKLNALGATVNSLKESINNKRKNTRANGQKPLRSRVSAPSAVPTKADSTPVGVSLPKEGKTMPEKHEFKPKRELIFGRSVKPLMAGLTEKLKRASNQAGKRKKNKKP